MIMKIICNRKRIHIAPTFTEGKKIAKNGVNVNTWTPTSPSGHLLIITPVGLCVRFVAFLQ